MTIINNEYEIRPPKMTYCSKCVYPNIAVWVTMEDDACSGCRVAEQKVDIDWNEREEMLREIFEEYRSKDDSNYDCVIPVSGGKDSYFQVYTVKERLGMNPLLVTYNANNYMPEGTRNLTRMREIFGCDHIFFTPSIHALIKMNRAGFKIQGDMNWHAHCGIVTSPVQAAVRYKIPLIIWGEHGPTHIGGQHSMHDFVEMSSRIRKEHFLRGYDWYDFLGGEEGLTKKDLLWARYPSDEELDAIGVRQIYLGNYVHWDEHIHAQKMIKEYGFEQAEQPFERTYRRASNLDDMHENGIHDYMKFIKFGYGRATDHVSKDIRAGHMSREEGIEIVRRCDHVKPCDLQRWLKYVNMTEGEYDQIADTFRDPRVWWKENGQWTKDNIWDE